MRASGVSTTRQNHRRNCVLRQGIDNDPIAGENAFVADTKSPQRIAFKDVCTGVINRECWRWRGRQKSIKRSSKYLKISSIFAARLQSNQPPALWSGLFRRTGIGFEVKHIQNTDGGIVPKDVGYPISPVRVQVDVQHGLIFLN